MESGKRSVTAEGTALFRAIHQIIDDDPKILSDPLAIPILGMNAEQIEAECERLSSDRSKRARILPVMRSRYTEDELAASLNRGVTQYVLLGAGLDTSPYRSGHAAEQLRIFEIDHPDTQRWKLECLQKAGIQTPSNLTHVPIDFERESLAEGLQRNGFKLDQPTFFSWLGVMYYLQPESVLDMFRYVAGTATGGQIVMDFMLDDSTFSEAKQISIQKASEYVASIGEPWLTRYSPQDLMEILRAIGFSKVTYFSNELATEHYLKGRSDGLSLDPIFQMMGAIV